MPYVEPFCGGCNTIDKVKGLRIGNDKNKFLISMWKCLCNGENSQLKYQKKLIPIIEIYIEETKVFQMMIWQ